MMRALYSGVSGLQVQQTRMDVIGNNIANVGTIGFKSSNVNFSEVLYQSVQRASGTTATGKGGVNAKQIGLGVSVGSIYSDPSTTGTAQITNNDWDMMISGPSFFIVNRGGVNYFTKVGAFQVDPTTGQLTTVDGDNVMGWGLDPQDPTKILKGNVDKIVINSPTNNYSTPEPTTNLVMDGNLVKTEKNIVPKLNSSTSPATYEENIGETTSIDIYDQQGNKFTVKFNIVIPCTAGTTTAPDPNKYKISVKDILDVNGNSIKDKYNVNIDGTAIESTFLQFEPNSGAFVGVGADPSLNAKTISMKIVPKPPVTTSNPDNFGSVTNDTTMSLTKGEIKVDFSNMTQYTSKKGTAFSADRGNGSGLGRGRMVGNMIQSTVSRDGIIRGIYDNGDSRILAQIAVTQFDNPAGLEKIGDNLYAESGNSGSFNGVGIDVTYDGGAIDNKRLELSDVDLSKQFADMIVTQRGFQANSKIITTADSMLDELMNIKR